MYKFQIYTLITFVFIQNFKSSTYFAKETFSKNNEREEASARRRARENSDDSGREGEESAESFADSPITLF